MDNTRVERINYIPFHMSELNGRTLNKTLHQMQWNEKKAISNTSRADDCQCFECDDYIWICIFVVRSKMCRCRICNRTTRMFRELIQIMPLMYSIIARWHIFRMFLYIFVCWAAESVNVDIVALIFRFIAIWLPPFHHLFQLYWTKWAEILTENSRLFWHKAAWKIVKPFTAWTQSMFKKINSICVLDALHF